MFYVGFADDGGGKFLAEKGNCHDKIMGQKF